MINRLAFRIYRGSPGAAVIFIAVSGLIVRKPGEIGQILQPPGLVGAAVLLNDAGKLHVKLCDL